MTVTFDYASTIATARKIRVLADEARSLANGKYKDTINGIDKQWDGAASSKFIASCETAREELLKRAGYMTTLAERLETIAAYIRDVEQAVKNLI
jgi:uncharacterized protein YukE